MEMSTNDGAPSSDPSRPLVYPPVTETRPSSRPIFLTVAIVFLALVLLGAVLLHNGLSGSGTASTASGQPGVTSPDPTGDPVPTVSSVVSFGSGRVLTASQHLAFSTPVHTVTLTVPERSTQVGGGMFNPRIANLQVLLSDHAPISISTRLRPGSDVTIPLPADETELDLAFVAYGAVRVSQPSSSRRAAALVTILSVSPATGVTSTRIVGSNVTNIGCFAADGTAQSCGTQTSDGWTVMRDSGDPSIAIIAQLDLQP